MGGPLFKRRKPDDPAGPEPAPPSAGQPGTTEALLDGAGSTPPAPAPRSPDSRPDTGLGVPPYRPAPPKEAPTMTMGRAPFPSPNPAAPNAPPGQAPRPNRRPPGEGERRTLVVGRGISVQGTVQDAERLVVEGTVEASMIHAAELSIAPGGVFKGEVEVEEAEIAGTIDGTLTARSSLIVRASGRLLGTAKCRRLQVEDGGQITGRMEMITDGAAPAAPRPAEPIATPS